MYRRILPVAASLRDWRTLPVAPLGDIFPLSGASRLSMFLSGGPGTMDDVDTEGAFMADGGSVAVMVDMITKVVSTKR